ncbi:MAG TPA: SLBB domain-containing protein, partial [Bacteroidales bacterium]|nr:SLBB domain-containing protein [Bacteroidales bacterium]
EIKLIRENRIIDTLDVYDLLFKGNAGGNMHLNDQDIIRIDPYEIRVAISGEVKRPMIYEMKSSENMNDLIMFSGGFTENAYIRRLKVYRNTATEKRIIDISQNAFNEFYMQNGDSVVVERILDRFENRVEIKGAVYRPGFYSTGDSLTLLQLLDKAEGLKGDAFRSRVVIYRTMENYNIESISVDLEALQKGMVEDPVLKREDIIVIPSVFDLQEEFYVQIDGEVSRPGKYPFMFNSNVEDVIIQAGGLLESASMARLEVARRVKDADATTTSNKVAEIFYFQISKELRLAEEGKNLKLEPFDRIFVRRSPGYEEQLTVTIEGEVIFPGKYSISNKDERISDVIRRAGGLTTDAYPNGANLIRVFPTDEKERKAALESTKLLKQEYWNGLKIGDEALNANTRTVNGNNNAEKLRILDSLLLSSINNRKEQAIGIDLVRILLEPHSKHDLIVQEGDILKVPKLLQTVGLSGALLHPITVRYDRKNSFRNYISSAGGFAQNARPSKSYVIYANGSVDITHSFMGIKKYPKLEPGAEIVVPEKELKRNVTPGEIISISSALTSMALIMVTLINRM